MSRLAGCENYIGSKIAGKERVRKVEWLLMRVTSQLCLRVELHITRGTGKEIGVHNGTLAAEVRLGK